MPLKLTAIQAALHSSRWANTWSPVSASTALCEAENLHHLLRWCTMPYNSVALYDVIFTLADLHWWLCCRPL